MTARFEALRAEALAALSEARDAQALQNVKAKYLGRKGELSGLLKEIGGLGPEERARVGKIANEVKVALESAIALRGEALERERQDAELAGAALDPTLP